MPGRELIPQTFIKYPLEMGQFSLAFTYLILEKFLSGGTAKRHRHGPGLCSPGAHSLGEDYGIN